MAQRQLISLVRRVRSSSFRPPLHPRCIADARGFCKIQKEFFSAAAKPTQRQTGGRVTDSAEKVASFQKQSNGKSVPRAVAEVSQNHTESNASPGKSSSKLLLVVGGCSVLVIGLLTLFPQDFQKKFSVGEKKEDNSHVLSQDADPMMSKDVPLALSEAKGKKASLYELNPQLVAKREDSSNEVPYTEKQDGQGRETRHTQNTENVSASAVPATVVSNSGESISPRNDSNAGNKISGITSNEHKVSEAQQKDDVSQLIGHLPDESLLPTNPYRSPNSNHSSSTFEKEDNISNISSSLINKESEGLSEDLSDSKEPLKGTMMRPSLLEAYYLANSNENSTSRQEEELDSQNKVDSNSQRHENREKLLGIKGGVLVDETLTDSVHNVFDLLEVVHAAEQRQAELDAQSYADVQKRLKQAFQQELKDAQAKELMYAEEANRLAKEIELEKQRAVAALESEQEKAKESLHRELKHKEEETEFKLKKAELLSKTQIAAAVAEEKLSYLKDVKDVKQELEALYIAFFTQSEEVRQSHTVHKLAVGTFALEDAMKRGVQVQKEVALISSSYGDTGSDPLLDAVISSIPEHVVKKGTMTPSQLLQQFETMKGEVLEFSLIPATGGGLLSHAAAKMVSILKVKEMGHYTDGVDAAVSRVQRLLTDGKLADAADLLEKAVQGTEAEVLAADWIKCARDRAVLEQMLLLLQAHATAVASSLA